MMSGLLRITDQHGRQLLLVAGNTSLSTEQIQARALRNARQASGGAAASLIDIRTEQGISVSWEEALSAARGEPTHEALAAPQGSDCYHVIAELSLETQGKCLQQL